VLFDVVCARTEPRLVHTTVTGTRALWLPRGCPPLYRAPIAYVATVGPLDRWSTSRQVVRQHKIFGSAPRSLPSLSEKNDCVSHFLRKRLWQSLSEKVTIAVIYCMFPSLSLTCKGRLGIYSHCTQSLVYMYSILNTAYLTDFYRLSIFKYIYTQSYNLVAAHNLNRDRNKNHFLR
jgi:hypothetical protein